MKLPKLTKYGKFRLRNSWSIPTSEKNKLTSTGYWIIHWEGVDMETGEIRRGFRGLFYPNLYQEGVNLEKELRKYKILLTGLKFKKR